MNVIIVDENVILRKRLRQILESYQYYVIAEAENGLHGYNKYCEYRPDLMIINLKMPIFDGINTLERLMAYDKNAKIIVMSEKNKKTSVFQALEIGAIHYFELPLEEEQIKKTLNDVNHIMNEME